HRYWSVVENTRVAFGGRVEVLKTDGEPVVTVMDFGQPFPLDPLPSGSPVSMAFAVKDGLPSMRFETHDSASMLFRHVDIDLAAYPMLAWRWYIELPVRSPSDWWTHCFERNLYMIHNIYSAARRVSDGGARDLRRADVC
ncbi:MAG: DUF3047 domain-containing protein, partial [Chthoniobacterales bacterium]